MTFIVVGMEDVTCISAGNEAAQMARATAGRTHAVGPDRWSFICASSLDLGLPASVGTWKVNGGLYTWDFVLDSPIGHFSIAMSRQKPILMLNTVQTRSLHARTQGSP